MTLAKLQDVVDNNGTLKFLFRIGETLLIAAIIGGITMYAGTAKMGIQIDNIMSSISELKKEVCSKNDDLKLNMRDFNYKIEKLHEDVSKVDSRLTDHILTTNKNR